LEKTGKKLGNKPEPNYAFKVFLIFLNNINNGVGQAGGGF